MELTWNINAGRLVNFVTLSLSTLVLTRMFNTTAIEVLSNPYLTYLPTPTSIMKRFQEAYLRHVLRCEPGQYGCTREDFGTVRDSYLRDQLANRDSAYSNALEALTWALCYRNPEKIRELVTYLRSLLMVNHHVQADPETQKDMQNQAYDIQQRSRNMTTKLRNLYKNVPPPPPPPMTPF